MKKYKQKNKGEKRTVRHRRIRAVLSGTSKRPRLCVYRSNSHIYAQLIDDGQGNTLAQVSDMAGERKGTKLDRAKLVGKQIGIEAAALNIKEVVFDRGGYIYTGRVKTLAEAVRESGIKF
jgi:large subunit ribosomal protein L18